MKIIYRPPEGADSLWQQQAEAAFRDDHDLRVYDPAQSITDQIAVDNVNRIAEGQSPHYRIDEL